MIGVQPFDLDETTSVAGTAIIVALVVGLSAIAFAKGRILLGALSIFVPVAGVVAAVRLAKPNSPWARKRYRGSRAHRLERARARFKDDRRSERIGVELRNAIAGAPSPVEDDADQTTTSVKR